MSESGLRVLIRKDSVVTDVSDKIADFLDGAYATFAPVAADGDALYIGSDLPFNQKFFVVSIGNNAASVVAVDVWWGGSWHPAVDVFDRTKDGDGKSMKLSGYVSFSPEWDKGWHRENSSKDVDGLSGTTIYNRYWTRWRWSADFSGTGAAQIVYIGHKFCSDNDLFSEYPDLNSNALRGAFKAGKTSWEDQILVASQGVVSDLISRDIIWTDNQILDFRKFRYPTMHRTAAIIYRGMGKAYYEQADRAEKAYQNAMSMKNFHVDLNQNAMLDPLEKRIQTTKWLGR